MSLKTGVNFTNILGAHFLYKSLLISFSLLTVWLWTNFCTKNALVKCWWNWPLKGGIRAKEKGWPIVSDRWWAKKRRLLSTDKLVYLFILLATKVFGTILTYLFPTMIPNVLLTFLKLDWFCKMSDNAKKSWRKKLAQPNLQTLQSFLYLSFFCTNVEKRKCFQSTFFSFLMTYQLISKSTYLLVLDLKMWAMLLFILFSLF